MNLSGSRGTIIFDTRSSSTISIRLNEMVTTAGLFFGFPQDCAGAWVALKAQIVMPFGADPSAEKS
jgi:hypothetical protein